MNGEELPPLRKEPPEEKKEEEIPDHVKKLMEEKTKRKTDSPSDNKESKNDGA
jgi:hypothetical protein